jgi:RNA polymerase primary sigma factor
MSVADLQELEEIKGLVTRGQQLGVLTFAEISGAVSELDLDEADVEELHGFLERAEIELVEELDPALAAADLERAPDKRGRRKPKTALDLKPDMTTDSLQLFLKDIGKVRLLTAQEEATSPSGSSAVTSTPSRRWSSPTCASSSPSPRTTATRACRSST